MINSVNMSNYLLPTGVLPLQDVKAEEKNIPQSVCADNVCLSDGKSNSDEPSAVVLRGKYHKHVVKEQGTSQSSLLQDIKNDFSIGETVREFSENAADILCKSEFAAGAICSGYYTVSMAKDIADIVKSGEPITNSQKLSLMETACYIGCYMVPGFNELGLAICGANDSLTKAVEKGEIKESEAEAIKAPLASPLTGAIKLGKAVSKLFKGTSSEESKPDVPAEKAKLSESKKAAAIAAGGAVGSIAGELLGGAVGLAAGMAIGGTVGSFIGVSVGRIAGWMVLENLGGAVGTYIGRKIAG